MKKAASRIYSIALWAPITRQKKRAASERNQSWRDPGTARGSRAEPGARAARQCKRELAKVSTRAACGPRVHPLFLPCKLDGDLFALSQSREFRFQSQTRSKIFMPSVRVMTILYALFLCFSVVECRAQKAGALKLEAYRFEAANREQVDAE